ncbi:MAG: DUF4255 domain-containing protein [Phormidesmis sp.]
MIFDALRMIQTGLGHYIQESEGLSEGPQELVVVDNIAMSDALGGVRSNMNDRIVMSLINLQEETTLKNAPNYRMENGRTIYQNPPVSLNLFVLFSALHPGQYPTALQRLARVIEFFQWKKEFSFTLPPSSGGGNAGGIAKDVRVLVDLYTLTFDQINHLWGTLGGKQVPFAMYRMRLVAISADKQQGEGAAITERVYE